MANPKNTELPLIDDIRLLGKILGDIVREQEGDAVYGLVEQVRKLSVSFHRDANQKANQELTKLLKGVKVGTQVEATVTEIIAIEVTAPKK